MNSLFSDELLIRKYLLGTLAEQDCEKIEEQLLSNRDFSELVDLIEDELIDEYLDGSLSVKDREALRSYFLRPPARQRKLAFAKLLRSQLAAGEPARKREQNVPLVPPVAGRNRWVALGACAAMAAMATLTLTLAFRTRQMRRSLEAEFERNRKAEADLVEKRTYIAKLEKEAEAIRIQAGGETPHAGNSEAALVLSPILSMDSGANLPVFKPKPRTSTVKVEIPLVDLPPQPYRVSLLAPNGKEMWSKAEVRPAGGELVFSIPYNGWQPGEYSITLTGADNGPHPSKARCFFWVSR